MSSPPFWVGSGLGDNELMSSSSAFVDDDGKHDGGDNDDDEINMAMMMSRIWWADVLSSVQWA